MAKKLIPNQLYEARICCIIKFYAEQMKRVITKPMARPIHLSRAQYMKLATYIFILFLHMTDE